MKGKKFKSGSCIFELTSEEQKNYLSNYYYCIITFESEKPYEDKIFIGSEMWQNRSEIPQF